MKIDTTIKELYGKASECEENGKHPEAAEKCALRAFAGLLKAGFKIRAFDAYLVCPHPGSHQRGYEGWKSVATQQSI